MDRRIARAQGEGPQEDDAGSWVQGLGLLSSYCVGGEGWGAERRWHLQVSQLLGRQLQRSHADPRKIQLLETGWGLNIVSPPEPRDGKVIPVMQ